MRPSERSRDAHGVISYAIIVFVVTSIGAAVKAAHINPSGGDGGFGLDRQSKAADSGGRRSSSTSNNHAGYVSASYLHCSSSVVARALEHECLALILPDGYTHVCNALAKDYTVSTDQYEYMSAMIYSPATGVIRDLAYYECSFEDRLSIQLSPHISTAPAHVINFMWPREHFVITTNTVEIFYHAKLADFYSSSNEVVAACFELKGSEPTAAAFHYACTATVHANVVQIPNVSSGSYIARAWVVSHEATVSASEFVQMFKDHITSGASTRNTAAGSIAFSVNLRERMEPKVGTDGIDNYSSQNLKIPRIVTPLHDLRETVVHVLLMSVRSNDRYKEAEVMLKSLLFHRDRRQASVESLVLHIVTDDAGVEYFARLWTPSMLQAFAGITVIIHDFDSVCKANIEAFLERNQLNISFHHSGVAGYCRLAIPIYFDQLFGNMETVMRSIVNRSSEANETLYTSILPSLLTPPSIICLETDQLVLADVGELWHYFYDHSDEDDVVAAPENYMPWNQPHSNFVDERYSTHFHQAGENMPVQQREGTDSYGMQQILNSVFFSWCRNQH
jgi:hypothetical protein